MPQTSPSAAYTVELLASGQGEVARMVLERLPEWFGRSEARETYIAAAAHLPTLAARAADQSIVGFVSLKRHTPVAAEVSVMGVLREHHGQGCGRLLIEAASRALRKEGVRWLTVKTLGPSHAHAGYAATRRFYEAVGFEPLEVFDTLWGHGTPCLYMAKPLCALRSETPHRASHL